MENEKLIRLLAGSIVAVIMISIILLAIIWGDFFSSGKENVETLTSEMELGTFNYVKYTREDALKGYLKEVIDLLKDANYDELSKLISKDYLDYSNFNVFTLKENLQSKKILGYQMTYNEYSRTIINKKNIYKVKLVAVDNTSSININIIENSPNNFELTFDNFILKDDTVSEKIIDGIKMEIVNKEILTDRIIFECKITNLNNYNVYLNSTHSPEIIAFRANGNNYTTEATILGGRSEILAPGGTMKMPLNVRLDFTSFNTISSILLSDVKMGDLGVSTYLEFPLK